MSSNFKRKMFNFLAARAYPKKLNSRISLAIIMVFGKKIRFE